VAPALIARVKMLHGIMPDIETMVFVHGDIHLSNVLRDDSGSLVLVDWEDAHIAPRETELARILDPRARFCRSAGDAATFLNHYQMAAGYRLQNLDFYLQLERLNRDINTASTVSADNAT
jgi:aminoglycoside phosphotransferase (APT) family kinase protein